LPRLRHPSSGQILFDKTDVSEINLRDLRDCISYSSQAPQIFKGTISQHIRYGNANSSDEDVVNAARLADAHNFITKMRGSYGAKLNEEGLNLSGGQKQRLDLARALIKKAPILILDEPTSSLDFEAQKKFYSTVYSLNKNIDVTIIIVSHDLRGIADADKIVVLNDGKIEAEGTHETLLLESPWYKKAWGGI